LASDTRERLLDAAEVLFATHGLSNTSVRMIVGAADANVAAIRFHFGSLENLKRAVLLRRFQVLVERRLAGLDGATGDRGGPPGVGDLLGIWFAPLLDMAASRDAGERAFPVILARLLVDRAPEYRALLEQELAPHLDRFLDAFQRALPELGRSEIALRFELAIGAFGHALNRLRDPRTGLVPAGRRGDIDAVARQVLEFCRAGFQAPPVNS
jgi:AcrR family transcriptional regulator